MKSLKRFLLVLILLFGFAAPALAKAPGIEAEVTKANVLALLKAYDKDGYYLVQNGGLSNGGRDFLQWFSRGRIVDDIDTCVHEQCHGCTHLTGQSERIYKGGGKFILVNFTQIYKSKEMASTVPEAGRVSRYDTYVANPIPYLSSNEQGIYGLLNEFTAYSYGMNNTVKLYKYYKTQGSDLTTWRSFINSGANDRLAYAEFRLFMLHYLYYAKSHYPSVYKGIMKNAGFKEAFSFIDAKFRANIAAYEKDLGKVVKLMNKNGHSARMDGRYFWCDNRGTGLFQDSYDAIMKVLKKSKYQKIYNALMK